MLVAGVAPVADAVTSALAGFRAEGAEVVVEAVVPPVRQEEITLNDKFTFEAYVLAVAGAGAVAGNEFITAHHLPGAVIGGVAGGAVGWIRLRMAQRHP